MKSFSITIIGATGRMGKEIFLAAQKHEINVVAVIASEQNFNKLFSDFLSRCKDNTLKISQEIPAITDVVLDFSSPRVTMQYLPYCSVNKIPMVIGTTGFTNEEKDIIAMHAKTIPILCSYNMSIVMNTLLRSMSNFVKAFGGSPEILIEETHHKHKKDSPSGTALLLGEAALKGGQNVKIKYNSIRIGEVTGEHKVQMSNEDEVLEITHKTFNRAIFANGALQAAEFIKNKAAALYTMHDVICEKICY